MQEKGCVDWRQYFLAPTGTMDPTIRRTWPIPEEYHYDAWIADRTCALLEGYKERGESFFLWSSFFDPHPTYLAPEPWASMYDPQSLTVPTVAPGEHAKSAPHTRLTQEERPDFSPWNETNTCVHGFHSHLHDEGELRKDIATYYGMISLMDKYIGVILKRLDELGLADDTVVVFTTDHGHFFGHHGLIAKGAFHYEDMIRVPLIARYPGVVPAGGESAALQSLVDLAPTFLNLCSIQVPRAMTGMDQSAVWTGEREGLRDCCIVENRHEPTTVHLKTLVEQRYKITVYYQQTYGELFDLQEDPGELNNLWDDPESAGLKSELLLHFLWGEMGKEPLWMPRVCGA